MLARRRLYYIDRLVLVVNRKFVHQGYDLHPLSRGSDVAKTFDLILDHCAGSGGKGSQSGEIAGNVTISDILLSKQCHSGIPKKQSKFLALNALTRLTL